jgi:large subunit ribosomal protein L39e
MGRKSITKKRRLGKAGRKNRRIPAFVIIRTKRKVSQNRYRRQWRTDKLRVSEE